MNQQGNGILGMLLCEAWEQFSALAASYGTSLVVWNGGQDEATGAP